MAGLNPHYTGDPKDHPLSEFSNGMTGTCLCGSISVTVHDTELFTKPRGHLCHCSNCRRAAGSFVAANFAIEKEKVTIKDARGTMKSYDDVGGSGKLVKRAFCGHCGNPVLSEPAISPNHYVLKLGMFPRIMKPEMETFTLHRNPWEAPLEGAIQYETVRGGKLLEK